MKFASMDEDVLLNHIREAQRVYMERFANPMEEGEYSVTDALPNAKVFYSRDMDEVLVLDVDQIVSVDSGGNSASVQDPEWETGWNC